MTDRDAEIAELHALFDEAWCDPHHPDFDPAGPVWSALPIDVRMSFIHARMRLAILERGWTVVGVFPVGDGGYHFAYTVGEACSIIVTGVSATAEPVLRLARDLADVREDGMPFDPSGEGLAVFAPVPDGEFREHCTAAVARGATHARQFIWQDDTGRWPWEIILGGPVLAGPDWRPQVTSR